MKKMLLLFITCLPIAACNYSDLSDINFERMSEAELAAYNQGRNIAQMIVCSENDRSFSRVRRRRCATVEQTYGSVEQADQLGVLNTVVGIGGASGEN
ncbi:MAG: hypothetical protein QGG67_10700 [Gammaproteobacteria bacterium]|jgi:hypothetical protein|nr:hypothetical protein [Gammaproteobacteria bacterium]MDP6096435.1 hypothetical protein [Gammaproteobacteria bacterium]MDP7455961.1 hypothetical protein [Gammaproteobacteria bacterium]HJO11635.1 hypothetical protein [Gammaproteobacteria bacterium]|tara:strand:- start:1253 stop:1546 length:294 start_codon:yes stop_codon:yes gene_type:complete